MCCRNVRATMLFGQSRATGGRWVLCVGQQWLCACVTRSRPYGPVLWRGARSDYGAIDKWERIPAGDDHRLSGRLLWGEETAQSGQHFADGMLEQLLLLILLEQMLYVCISVRRLATRPCDATPSLVGRHPNMECNAFVRSAARRSIQQLWWILYVISTHFYLFG